MEINFDKKLTNMVGQELTDEKGEPLTLGKLACEMLLTDFDENTTGTAKFEQYQLARLVYKGGKLEFNKEFIEKIKAVIGKKCAPIVVGTAYEALGE